MWQGRASAKPFRDKLAELTEARTTYLRLGEIEPQKVADYQRNRRAESSPPGPGTRSGPDGVQHQRSAKRSWGNETGQHASDWTVARPPLIRWTRRPRTTLSRSNQRRCGNPELRCRCEIGQRS